MLMTNTGCKPGEKVFIIGIVSNVSIHARVIEGFKAGMSELGYIEGKNVKYIYNGITDNNVRAIDDEIGNLLSGNMDLLLSIGNDVSLRAKKAVYGSDIPVLFSACSELIESGIVEDLSAPGNNITGVRTVDSTSKAMEWLISITPNARKIYLPYNPDDFISIINIPILEKAASQLGVELVLHKVYSVEETVSDIEDLPGDIDAIFRIPSPTLDPGNIEISRAAIKRGIPLGSRVNLDEDVLLTFATDLFNMGRQTSRLADQILHGVKPGSLPIETSDPILTINLKTAEEIGLKISDSILSQANVIIR